MGEPIRADHRYIRRLLDIQYSGKVEHVPEGYNRIAEVFSKAGGSWERLFDGSTKDGDLLKRCIKVAVAQGILPAPGKWVPDASKKPSS
mgnify:CR=1 FL=1